MESVHERCWQYVHHPSMFSNRLPSDYFLVKPFQNLHVIHGRVCRENKYKRVKTKSIHQSRFTRRELSCPSSMNCQTLNWLCIPPHLVIILENVPVILVSNRVNTGGCVLSIGHWAFVVNTGRPFVQPNHCQGESNGFFLLAVVGLLTGKQVPSRKIVVRIPEHRECPILWQRVRVRRDVGHEEPHQWNLNSFDKSIDGCLLFGQFTSFENNDFVQKNIACVLSFAHHIEFRQDTDRSFSHRIFTTRHDQRIGGDKIDVRRCDGQNETVLIADVFNDNIIDLLHDISRLSLRWNFDHTGQIDQRKIDHWNEDGSFDSSREKKR